MLSHELLQHQESCAQTVATHVSSQDGATKFGPVVQTSCAHILTFMAWMLLPAEPVVALVLTYPSQPVESMWTW
jgi:hypothetical protein